MKKSLFIVLLGFFLTTVPSMAENSIAVVDLQKVVSNSAQVKQLKQEHSKKMEELNKIIVNARGEIANETDENKIAKIEEKYTNEFNTKKSLLEETGVLKDIESKGIKWVFVTPVENPLIELVDDVFVGIAKKENYDFVFAKSVVLYGGKDITDEIHVK